MITRNLVEVLELPLERKGVEEEKIGLDLSSTDVLSRQPILI
jgi:hypothetical protein